MVSIVNLLAEGPISYEAGLRMQRETVARRQKNEINDTLLLLEHTPTVTYGKAADLENLLLSSEDYDRRGVALLQTDRGGDVTYHGPGQLVAYPIVHLGENRRDIHRYVRTLEKIIIASVEELGIMGAGRADWHAGVWVGDGYLAALGVKVSRWVTHHGIALNVTNAVLDNFSTIIPCGVGGKYIVTVEGLAHRPVSVGETASIVSHQFARVWAEDGLA